MVVRMRPNSFSKVLKCTWSLQSPHRVYSKHQAHSKAYHGAMLSGSCQLPTLHSATCRYSRRSTQPARASAYSSDPYGAGPGAGGDRGLGSWLQTPWDMLALGPRAAAGVLLHGREL